MTAELVSGTFLIHRMARLVQPGASLIPRSPQCQILAQRPQQKLTQTHIRWKILAKVQMKESSDHQANNQPCLFIIILF